MPRAVRLLLPVLLTSLAGCSKYQSPMVSVGPAELVEATDEAVRIDVELSLTNPNDVAIELRTVSYAVTLAGTPVFQGRRAARATLPAGGSTRLAAPVVIRREDLAAATDVRYSLAGSVVYVTPEALVELLLDTGVRRPTVAFRGDGQVPADALAAP
ncbi:MAG: LEA type 2 family protein [Planctomycetota bacterium]|jgi:hypothetical protein